MNTDPAAFSAQAAAAPMDGARRPAAGGARKKAPGPPLSQSLRPRGPVELEVGQYERPEATVVTVSGELDILTAPKFSASIDEVVRGRTRDVVVDLSETRFVDSAGLQVLLSAQRRVTRRARWLALICPAGPVRRVIELARLTETLGVLASLKEYEAQMRLPDGAA
jgi:anti-sigma B factor antagonist